MKWIGDATIEMFPLDIEEGFLAFLGEIDFLVITGVSGTCELNT